MELKCILNNRLMRKGSKLYLLLIALFTTSIIQAQLLTPKESFNKADTLRGSNNGNKDWWDVLHYAINITPDIKNKTISGSCSIKFKVLQIGKTMQIDLQDSLIIDKIIINGGNNHPLDTTSLTYSKSEGVYLVTIPELIKNSQATLIINYHGKPREAISPPWDGGWIWAKDSLGNPWISVACQELGASSWYPCKDMQGDKPDFGATIQIQLPDSLICVSNGICEKTDRYINTISPPINLKENKSANTNWHVRNPINNYNIVPYIGKYANFRDTILGEDGKLNLSYWVLKYNLEKAKKQFVQVKPMIHCFEYWFGKYPFYNDSYKLIEAPYLGMEHQSAIGYGNGFQNGYKGTDLSSSGWGKKWDFIIVHESGHEWFGNSITANDIADLWIHEGFTMYSEVLYTQWLFGIEAGNDYCFGLRKRILNDKPMIGPYGVNKEGSGDIYYKGANMIHIIRNIINNDTLFRKILRGLNTTFYHQTVSTQQIETYITQKANIDFRKVFDQYLRTIQIPTLHYNIKKAEGRISINWTNCIDGFNMPLTIPVSGKRIQITTESKEMALSKEELAWFKKDIIERHYYISTRQN